MSGMSWDETSFSIVVVHKFKLIWITMTRNLNIPENLSNKQFFLDLWTIISACRLVGNFR